MTIITKMESMPLPSGEWLERFECRHLTPADGRVVDEILHEAMRQPGLSVEAQYPFRESYGSAMYASLSRVPGAIDITLQGRSSDLAPFAQRLMEIAPPPQSVPLSAVDDAWLAHRNKGVHN